MGGSFKKTKEEKETENDRVIIAMPMFNNGETFNIDKIVNYLKDNWNVSIAKPIGENGTSIFTIEEETIALATMPFQIPFGDIEGASEYAYNWMTAEEDLKNHNSHITVTLLSNNTTQVERFSLITKVLSSIVATTSCLGVYKGTQSLLIPREQYLNSANLLKENRLPIDLWIYIGLREVENKNSAYTYGLSSFGKLEMEFINVKLSLEEMYSFLINICSYVLKNDITFNSGETLGYTDEQKIKIIKSKGVFVEGETLKLEM